jgi:hypothetical protein
VRQKKNQQVAKGELTQAMTMKRTCPVRSGAGLTMRKRMKQAVRLAGHPDEGRKKKKKTRMSSLAIPVTILEVYYGMQESEKISQMAAVEALTLFLDCRGLQRFQTGTRSHVGFNQR